LEIEVKITKTKIAPDVQCDFRLFFFLVSVLVLEILFSFSLVLVFIDFFQLYSSRPECIQDSGRSKYAV